MTYIKWIDEVEKYLVTLPDEEKQKIFSYFSEMYADKRDAGKSEEQIIEEFGAPYDVAKKILDDRDSPDAPAPQQDVNDPPIRVIPPLPEPPQQQNDVPQRIGAPQQNAPQWNGAPQQNGAPMQNAPQKNGAAHVVASVILTIFLVCLSIFLIGSCIAGIIQGFATIGAALGAVVAAKEHAGVKIAYVGFGLINVGASFMLLAPVSILIKFLWKKLKEFK